MLLSSQSILPVEARPFRQRATAEAPYYNAQTLRFDIGTHNDLDNRASGCNSSNVSIHGSVVALLRAPMSLVAFYEFQDPWQQVFMKLSV